MSSYSNKAIQYIKNNFLVLGLIYVFFFTYVLQVKLIDGDDLNIYRLGKDIPLKNAFHMNARITSNLFAAFLAKFNLIVWKICTPMILTLLVYSLSTIIIGKDNLPPKSRNYIYLFVFLSFLYIYPFVFTSTVFWVAGSVSYIWPISIGIYSFLHYIKYYNGEVIRPWNLIVFNLSAFYASFGQEQISTLLTSFSLLFLIYYYFEKRKIIGRFLIIQTIIYLSGTFFLISPFSQDRMMNDIRLYYPDYLNISSFEKIYRGLIWLCNQLFNKDKLLVVVLLGLLILYNLKYTTIKIRKNIITAILILPLLILVLSFVPVDSLFHSFLRDINPFKNIQFGTYLRELTVFDIKKFNFTNQLEYLRFVFWVFYLVALPIIILFIGKNRSINYKLFIVLAAAYLASSIMFFAPSIYESNHRVFLTMDILMVLCIGIIFKEINLSDSKLKIIFIFYSIYPILVYLSLQLLWHSGYYLMF